MPKPKPKRSRYKREYIAGDDKSKTNFSTVANVLDTVFHDLNLDEKMKDFKIMEEWNRYMDSKTSETVASKTFAHRINKDRTLVVGVKSAVLANELQFMKNNLESGFKNLLKQKKMKYIKNIVFELR